MRFIFAIPCRELFSALSFLLFVLLLRLSTVHKLLAFYDFIENLIILTKFNVELFVIVNKAALIELEKMKQVYPNSVFPIWG